MKKTLLFYNLYPKTNWEIITKKLLLVVPHDEIIVHVSLPGFPFLRKRKVIKELSQYPKIIKVFYSKNSKTQGESIGFEYLKSNIDLSQYSILTYIHSKGSSKKRKNTSEIQDWTELMRYFVVEQLAETKKVFNKGFYLYGVNIREFGHKSTPETPYHYSGNFVSVNLEYLLEKILTTPYDKTYFALEMFWGRISPRKKAYSAHESNIKNHYNTLYPKVLYQK